MNDRASWGLSGDGVNESATIAPSVLPARPNGQPYRARKGRRAICLTDAHEDQTTGVIILRGADDDATRVFAQEMWAYWDGDSTDALSAKAGWFREHWQDGRLVWEWEPDGAHPKSIPAVMYAPIEEAL